MEERVLLSAAPPDATTTNGAWFAQLHPSASIDSASAVDRWIVRLSDEALGGTTTVADAANLLPARDFDLQVLRGLGLPGQLLLETSGAAQEHVTAWFQATSSIAYFQPDSKLHGQVAPNDPSHGGQIGLHNTQQAGGVFGADISAQEAWNLTTGSGDVVVAVIDSGIDQLHPDLADNIWTNPAEIAGDGLDNDGNGKVDDVHGYDFVNDSAIVQDDNGHGTHVAGIIGAEGNNGVGITGVTWHSSLMNLKYLDSNLEGLTSNAIEAVNYVTFQRLHNGVNVRVINASWGDANSNPALEEAIRAAGTAGILVVAAAGNGDALSHGLNLDQGNGFFPASFDLPNVISVGASTPADTLAGFSNYGAAAVDLVAPGVGIYSTKPNNDYGTLNGTSMAAPHVAGVAALVFAYKPYATVDEVRNAILQGADPIADLAGKVASGARLNAYGALTAPTFAPTGTLTAADDIELTTAASHTLVVTYSGESALDAASIKDSNVTVSRAGFGSTAMAVTLQSLVQVDAHHIVATYVLTPPIGSRDYADNTTHQGWDATDNGTYEVYLGEGEVRDALGLASHKNLLGTFVVSIFDASVLFVNTTSDSITGTLSHGLSSDVTPSPSSSLRAAVLAANAMPGPNTIVLPEGIYTLTLAGAGEDASSTGDLDISAAGALTILGGGAPYTVITAAGLDRVFDVRPGAALNLNRVTLSGGAGQVGAGLRNAGLTTLTLTTVADNTAPHSGGGIYNSAQILLFQSTVSHNSTTEQLSSGGGGMFNSGTATIQSSTFSSNVTAAGLLGGNGGGAIFNDGTGVINAVNSTLSGNLASVGGGGAIYSRGTLNLTNDTIVENRAPFGSSGGVFNEAGSTAPIAFQTSFGTNGPALGSVDNPGGIVVDSVGNIYVADTYNHRIQVFNPEGFVVRAFGGYGQGVGQFDQPTRLSWDASGYLYVLDELNRRVQVFDELGVYQRTVGGPQEIDRPTGLTVEGAKIYVSNLDGRITIFSLAGNVLGSFYVYSNSSSISGASDIDVDTAGLIYVTDIWNSSINVFNELGTLLLEIGNHGPSPQRIDWPGAVRIGPDGNVYVLEANIAEIKTYTTAGAFVTSRVVPMSSTFAIKSVNEIYVADGGGVSILSAGPTVHIGRLEVNDFSRGIAVDSTGNIYVADTQNNRVQVFNSALTMTRQFGLGGTAAGKLNAPEGIAVNASGKIVVADTQNNRIQVFSNDGTWQFAFGGPGSGNGQFQRPVAVAIASGNSIVVADRDNQRIQIFDSAGNFIRKFDAGVGDPASLAIDSQGRLYVSDGGGDLVKVFTLLGAFVTSFGGNGSGPGQFSSPAGIAFDASGNVFVVDRGNHRVQVFDSAHSYLYQFGGLGSSGGKFASPLGLALDPTGNIYVSETGNDRNQHLRPAAAATRTVNLANTIIAANVALSEPNVIGAFNSLGHNLVGSIGFSASGFNSLLGDLVGSMQTPLNPQLGPLDDNGGPTQTHAPLLNSPAIDGGDNAYMPTKDQVGRTRPQQVNTSIPARVDIGAVERADSVIRGRVFNDLNGNGELDANEAGLGGWTVYIDANNNHLFDAGESSTTTAFDDPATPLSVETGQYALSSSAGTYKVRVVAPPAYTITSPSHTASDSEISLERWLYDPDQDEVHQVFLPALDQGKVAFWGHANSGGLGLYTLSPSQGLQLIRHISDLGGYSGASSDVTFDQGVVAYNGISSLPSGVYLTRQDGTHLTVADGSTAIPNAAGTFAGFQTPYVADGLAVFTTLGDGRGLYLGNGTGTLASLVDVYREFGGQPTSYLNITDVAFDGSSYAFNAATLQSGQFQYRIYKGSSGGIVTIADFSTPVPGGIGNFTGFWSLNGIATSNGNVFFSAYSADRSGIYVGSSPGDLRVVADTTTLIPEGVGAFNYFSSLNAGEGFYAFYGEGENGQRGIYAEIDGVLRRIVDLNTPLFGGDPLDPQIPATSLGLGRDAVDGNQIAFQANIGGWSAVFVATLSLENAHTLSVGVGAELSGVNFGAQPFPGSIQGTVYNDLDQNGVRDLSDPPIAGRVVFLDQNNNGTLDAVEVSAVTDALGQYSFAGLAPLTTYRVVEQVPSGWSVTAPTTGRWVVPLSAGQAVVNNDFGNYQGSTSGGAGSASVLRGKLFVDANSNGVQDVGESGLAGMTMFLDVNGNGMLDPTELSTVTVAGDANTTGNYTFSGLGAGGYSVRLATPSGYQQTSPIGNTLTALSPRSTGVQPQQGAIGDFNLDGYPDLVVPGSGSNDLSIFVNDGFGVLNLSSTILFGLPPGVVSGSPLVGFAPSFAAVADFNNDGKPDIAVPNTNSNNVAILRNTTAVGAAPSFNTTTISTPATGPIGIAVADFNRDGYADLAVVEEYGVTGGTSGKLAIFLNNGVASPGTFSLLSDISVGRFAVYVSPIQSNDDNGDSQIDSTDYVDLAVANYRDNTITILKNNGSGGFTQFGAPLSVGSQPASIATADFNHDGKPDLAVANLISTSVSVLFGQGNSAFGAAQNYLISGTANAASLVATDLDNDGNVDLAVSTGASGAQARVRILHNRGDGVFVPLVDKSVGSGTLNTLQAVFIVAADLDHDAQLTNDLVVINGYSNKVTVLRNSLVQGTYQTTIGDPETVTNLSFGILPTSNAAPSFVAGGDRNVLEDAGPQSVAGWATGINAGAPSEASQTLNFVVSSSNTSLFSSQPAISSNGTLTFTPAANANGSATVYVLLHDNGGTANSGVDTSSLFTFTITVTPVNDRPSFVAGANRTVLEDAGPQSVAPWAVFISKGPLDEASQTLTFLVSNDNNALFTTQPTLSPDGTLTFVPAADANGTATVTVSLQDSGGTLNGGFDTSVTRTFSISITSVNDAPARLAGSLSNLTVAANSGQTPLGLGALNYGPGGGAAESMQTLNYIVTSVPSPSLGSIVLADGVTVVTVSTPYLLSEIRNMRFKTATGGSGGSGAFALQIQDSGGTANGGVNLLVESMTVTVTAPFSSVVGRHLFYNQSGTASPLRYDGNNLAINANDDLAIATNKSAYLPGSGAATFANVSSYTKGINGIMIDIGGTHGTITAADFIFRVGNNNTPNSWVAAPAPNSISVRAGAGVSGSDRVVLTWANGAITKKWLEVIVLANANTNLAQKVGYPVGQGDVFFFGNAVANSGSGDNATQAIVNVTDELGARNNPAGVLTNIPVTNLFDYNRDGAVNTTDALAARNNPTNTGNVVRYISIANPPATPEASPASDDGGVASALSAPSVGGALSSAGVPRWLVNRLQNVDLNSGPIARYFEHLADQNTPAARKILVAADKVADELGLDDSLLDLLLEELGLD